LNQKGKKKVRKGTDYRLCSTERELGGKKEEEEEEET
jgi:hypothetical protein